MSSGWYTALDINYPDEILPLAKPPGKLRVPSYVIRVKYYLELSSDDLWCWPKSSGLHNIILILRHPHDLAPGRISSGRLMAHVVCLPDEIWCYLSHLDDMTKFESPGWLTWYPIHMSYGKLIMSCGSSLLSHLDEITDFKFSQLAVALQRLCTPYGVAKLGP